VLKTNYNYFVKKKLSLKMAEDSRNMSKILIYNGKMYDYNTM